MRVGVLAGGRSSEREVSLATSQVISQALREAGHDVALISIDRNGIWRKDGRRLSLDPSCGLLECDVVFPALHGRFGEDGTVQGLLELLDVPYVGAGVLASSLCMDKAQFKHALAAHGVPQVRYVAVHEQRWRADPGSVRADAARLRGPLFVKPARLGSSLGIVKIQQPDQLPNALETAFAHDGVAVIEEYSPGVEVECAVIGNSDPETSVPGQIVLKPGRWYDYRAKYTRGGYTLVAPAQLSAELTKEVQRLARETYTRVNCSGLARIDFFIEAERILVNEVNTLPGFTPTSDFPKLWQASGVDLIPLLERLLAYARERYRLEHESHTF